MKTSLSLILVLFSIGVFAQEQTLVPDSRIATRFGDEYVARNMELHPEGIRYMNYFLNNGYYIAEMSGKYESVEYLYEINNQTKEIATDPVMDFDFDNINIYKYNIEQGNNYRMIYRIGNTGKVLVLYSKKEFMEFYNNHKKNGN